MAEATTSTAAVAAFSTATGAVVVTTLAAFGLDVVSMGAGLCGCVAVRTLLPATEVRKSEIALVTLGSVIFASFATPWFAPYVGKVAALGAVQAEVGAVHIKASTAFVVGAFPKPLFLALRFVLQRASARVRKLNGGRR